MFDVIGLLEEYGALWSSDLTDKLFVLARTRQGSSFVFFTILMHPAILAQGLWSIGAVSFSIEGTFLVIGDEGFGGALRGEPSHLQFSHQGRRLLVFTQMEDDEACSGRRCFKSMEKDELCADSSIKPCDSKVSLKSVREIIVLEFVPHL